MKVTKCFAAGLLFAALAIPSLSRAQSSTTSLNGVVLDSSGAVIPGTVIELDNSATGFHSQVSADAKGQYAFPQLTPGSYSITATAAGMAKITKVAELLVNQPATISFTLSIQGATTTVNVSAEAQTLNMTDATIGNSVNNTTIQALPMEGRNVPDLLSLQPGVLYLGRVIDQTVDSRSGAVSGARSDQTNVTLDGVDDNDQANGLAFTGVLRSTLDSVEEFRVTTTQANADAGRTSGAQVVLVTKSGTNQLHGSLYEYNRNTLFAANDWFNKQAQLAAGLPDKPGQLLRNTFGGTVGGAIKKDKLFYFFNYEGQRTAENQQETQTVPTASLRAGNVEYKDVNGNTDTLTPAQIANMDPGCTACTYGPGVDPNTLAVFNMYPLPNGTVLGDGLNTASYTWSAPNPISLNTFITRIDYNMGAHSIFVRGNLQADTTSGPPQFPNDPASYALKTNSKGLAAGDTWTIGTHLINAFRYGYIREGIDNAGAGNGPYVDFVGMSSLNAENRSTINDIPVHNFIDDITWVKHEHTLQFGVNYRLVHNISDTNGISYSSADGNFSYVNLSGIANTGQSFDPAAFGYPAVAGSFANSFNNAMIADVGLVSDINTTSNYSVSADGSGGNLLPQGAMIDRNYKNNEFEYYLQDSWRIRPNLTITFGIRHALQQTPYEVNGQQVQPTIDWNNWFIQRGLGALKGESVQPLIAFGPSGQARGLRPYWPMNTADIAPRFAIAYSPDATGGPLHALFGSKNTSSIRAGFGVYYDHYGEGIVDSFAQLGSFSLSSTSTSAFPTIGSTARYAGINVIPTPPGAPPPSSISYPYQPSANAQTTGFQNVLGVDDHLKTPYSYDFNTSIDRQLKGGFTLEVAYVGRLGRHLLQQYDWGQALDLVDPASGVDYFTAATELSKDGYAGDTTVAPIPYWEDLFPDAARPGVSATQSIYNLWKTLLGNETYSLYNLDILCNPGCGGQRNRYWSPQYGSIFAWNSNGFSSYNAGQIVLRHPFSHGLQADVSYTYSKSLDLGSDAERTCQFCRGGVFSPIISTWNPRDNYAVSDFDAAHIINGDWVYNLPLGHNYRGASRAVLGGWQLTGLWRWTSGLPFGIINSQNWATNWTQVGWLVQTAPISLNKHIGADNVPQAFSDPSVLQNGYLTGTPVRNGYPGESGQRNQFRGDGYFGIDSGLSKSWTFHEGQAMKFAWEVFNVTNSARFDVHSINNDVTSSGFGDYTRLLTSPRVQQFSLRYSF